jgi:hypothetical protein
MTSELWPEGAPKLDLSEWKVTYALNDADIPWWAVALLDADKLTKDQIRVRHSMLEGREPHYASQIFWTTWADVVSKARTIIERRGDVDYWIEAAWADYNHEKETPGKLTQAVWDAALCSVRSFVQWAGLQDDDGKQFVMKPFHVRTLNSLRRNRQTVALLPFEHAKSVLVSYIIPMMDWCEWKDCSQIRVYLDDDSRMKAVDRLKQQVEYNERLQKLFPWFRRPRKGDKSNRWNQKSFSIGGRTIADAGFRAFTIKAGRIGHRANRVIYDDIVTSTECDSESVQKRNYDSILASGQTTPQTSTHQSRYGTSFTTFGLVGTLFSPIDANSRCWENFQIQERKGRKDYKTLRFDIFPQGEANADIVLWPEWRDSKAVHEMKLRLGPRVFMMRCRNRLQHEGLVTFPEDKVLAAMHDGEAGKPYLEYGKVPPNCDIVIGFDPAKGSTSRWAKNPAIVLYGLRNLADMTPYGPFVLPDRPEGPQPIWQHYIIKWKRLYGYDFTRQIDEIINWQQEYNCPVAIEMNNQQIHYWDYLKQIAPHIPVVDHETGLNKRNADQGVDTFAPLFYNGMIAIHAGGAPLDEVDAFRKEWIQWKSGPTPRGEFSDLVMASWIARYQLERAVFSVVREQRQQAMAPPRIAQVASTMWRGPMIPYGRGMRNNPYR